MRLTNSMSANFSPFIVCGLSSHSFFFTEEIMICPCIGILAYQLCSSNALLFFIYIQVYHSRMGERWGDKLSPSLTYVICKPKSGIYKNVSVVDPDPDCYFFRWLDPELKEENYTQK
jgi:hypothetical protein